MAAAMAAPTITPLLIDLIDISPVASMLEVSVGTDLSPIDASVFRVTSLMASETPIPVACPR